MHDQSFKILEFDQLCGIVRPYAQTPVGQARADKLQPFSDRAQLQNALQGVDECLNLRGRSFRWSFDDISDPTELLGRLRVLGSTLESVDILQVARLCDHAMAARAVILDERESAKTLWQLVADLPRELSSLTARIANKILPNGEIDDRASPELARIRHDITRLRSNITRSLESLMRKSAEAIQDEIVTVRNERFVIPIKADHRGRIPGVGHGFSSSGATVFVEPIETVESNNELQGLRELEVREVFRILSNLTEELRDNLPAVHLAVEAVSELDFINAKAAFSEAFRCVIPTIEASETGSGAQLELLDARHPLLEENFKGTGESVVPVSFSLGAEHNCLIISGANAGGKTVVLKTAGLLSLMALSGLPVPAAAATIPFYRMVLADIGDHQSLAANLSTFTSHIANIARMVEMCEPPALVLLDEVGTGTDPDEGSALGVAVVDHFRKSCGAQVIATTHYSGLKMYATTEPGVLNASVEFDEQTLRPTYRLVLGLAGASSGLEIARRFGVPDVIVQQSLTLVKDSSRRASDFLVRIKREAENAEALRRALEEEREAVAEKYAVLDRDAEKKERARQIEFEQEMERAKQDFHERSQELLAAVSDKAERLKLEREVKKRSADFKKAAKTIQTTAQPDKGKGRVRVIRDGEEVSPEFHKTPAGSTKPQFVVVPDREIKAGDKVRLPLGTVGVVEQIKHGEAEVRVKSLRFREKLEALELVEEISSAPKDKDRLAKLRPVLQAEVRGLRGLRGLSDHGQSETDVELIVIGQTTDQAVDTLDKFLDNAFMNNLTKVRIVHGHGTGALRRAIGEHLKQHPHVERFSPAPPNQGGSGATLVDLKA